MLRQWLIIILFAILSVTTISAKALTKATKFDDYLEILKKNTSTATDKIRIAEAIWGEIRADYPDDLSKTTTLYQQIPYILNNCAEPLTTDEVQALHELQQEIRRHLIVGNAQRLADAWNGKEFANDLDLLWFTNNFTDFYDTPLVLDIYTATIDEIYAFQPPELLARYIKQTAHSRFAVDFQIMCRTELYLYWKFMNRGEVNDLYLFNVAYYFYDIRMDAKHYESFDDNLKSSLDKAIGSLPTSLQNFYFESKVCLKSKVYTTEYLYISNKFEIDANRRNVLMNYSSIDVTQAPWLRDMMVFDAAHELKLEFALKSSKLGTYMYLERNDEKFMDLIVAWQPRQKPDRSNWSVQLVGNQLVFSQDGFIICAGEGFLNPTRRYVYAYNDYKHTPTNELCQWTAVECP